MALKIVEKWGPDGLLVLLLFWQGRHEYRIGQQEKKLPCVNVQDCIEIRKQQNQDHEHRFSEGRREFDNVAGALRDLSVQLREQGKAHDDRYDKIVDRYERLINLFSKVHDVKEANNATTDPQKDFSI